jgi:hypothetical protein
VRRERKKREREREGGIPPLKKSIVCPAVTMAMAGIGINERERRALEVRLGVGIAELKTVRDDLLLCCQQLIVIKLRQLSYCCC